MESHPVLWSVVVLVFAVLTAYSASSVMRLYSVTLRKLCTAYRVFNEWRERNLAVYIGLSEEGRELLGIYLEAAEEYYELRSWKNGSDQLALLRSMFYEFPPKTPSDIYPNPKGAHTGRPFFVNNSLTWRFFSYYTICMFSDPVKNIEQCGIQAGMEIADFGSGSGHYTLAASKALMATGRVYAVDIQQDLLSKLKNTATKEGLYNIEVIWGDIDKLGGTKLRDSTMDLVLLCNIMFQLENKEAVVNEVKRVLKPAGRVLVVDWTDSFGGIGPKPEAVVTKIKAQEIFEKAGFHLDREISAGSHHYGLIYKKL